MTTNKGSTTVPTTTATTTTATGRVVKKKNPIEVANCQNNDIAGFGNNVVKLVDQTNGSIVAYIGLQNGEEKIYFPRTLTLERLEVVYELIQKKKFNKYILNEQFDKAQEFADRKLKS